MAMTLEEFMQRTNAELVAGNIIVGALANRKLVGTYDGTFNLNEAGQELLAELEGRTTAAEEPVEEKPTRSRKKAVEAEAPAEAKTE